VRDIEGNCFQGEIQTTAQPQVRHEDGTRFLRNISGFSLQQFLSLERKPLLSFGYYRFRTRPVPDPRRLTSTSIAGQGLEFFNAIQPS
jgi:hypothetical protein